VAGRPAGGRCDRLVVGTRVTSAPSPAIAAITGGRVTAGTKTRAGTPVSWAIRATARPWLPSVAVTKARPGRAAARDRSSATVDGAVARPSNWRTAHDAPRILNARKPSRDDSSFTNTRAARSSAASAGTSVSGVGA
jgi:hypothetical protein